ncbi:MAG: hypothetical protein F4X39_09470 [Acidobacteriia bacterium]|nr:hypothetical protein [Terriglobia bacterium]
MSTPIGCDMRKYYKQVLQRAAETGRPVSELLFEDYCKRVGIHCERIQEEHGRTPDYELVIDGQTIIAEVKEFTKNRDDTDPGAGVRKKIQDSSPQIKARTAGRYPGMLVLYDNGRIVPNFLPNHIMTAMYGQMVLDIAIPRDISIKPYITGARLGPKKKMTEDTNTSISAIGALVVTEPGLILKLHVYHNRFARVPIDPKLLARRGILQHRFDIENRIWVEC